MVIAGADLLGPVFTRMKTALHVNEESAGFHVFRIIRTFIVVNIGWYFDAIPKFGDVLLAFRNTLFNFRPDELLLQIEVYVKSYGLLFAGESYATAAVALVFVFVISVLAERGMNVEQRLLAAPVPARCVLYAAVLMIIMVSTIYGVDGGFMYANF